MEFNFIKQKNLPKLSWGAVLEHGSEKVNVYCGDWVETNATSFVEGAWNLPFSEHDFEKATVFMGSGGKIINNKVIFATPTHTLERIFGIRNNNLLYVSNSMSFALSMSNNEMDPSYIAYQADFDSIILGLDKYVKSSPLKSGVKIEYFCHCNIEIDKELGVRKLPKNTPPDFKDFHEYRNLLVSNIHDIADNAQSEHRARKYKLLATASTGYDSSCVAALAREVSCSDVYTFKNASPKYQLFGEYSYKGKQSDDSGEAIAKKLGYENIIIRDRWSYLDQKTDIYEAESCASGNLYYNPVIIYEDVIQQRVLLTGHHGGAAWILDPKKSNYELKGGGLCGASMCESRLRIGFIHAPIPYIGGCWYSSINKISNSKEMSPWRLGTHYDRPIPRRILEEKGVPRNFFGQSKKAVQVPLMGTKNNLLSQMTEKAKTSFIEFHSKHKRERNIVRQFCYDFMTGLYLFLSPRVLGKIIRKIGFHKKAKSIPSFTKEHLFKFSRNPRTASFLFPWGVSIVKNRYILGKNQDNFS
ncbi:MAG: hypothetical protein JW715_13545 [Sedimentisphaerales bacterium]|nr:hypothetical protein [Sedimentisphaerales bacterium]